MRKTLSLLLVVASIALVSPSNARSLLPQAVVDLSDEEAAILAARDAAQVADKEADVVLTKEEGTTELEQAIRRGWWDLAAELIDLYKQQGLDLSSTVYQTAAAIRKELQRLQDTLSHRPAGNRAQNIAPAFEWAQSPDSVFLNVKFSHKLDTPATLSCETETVTLKARQVHLVATCPAKRKRFELNLELRSDIDPDASTWSMSSVGRAMFTLKKAQQGNWPRLLRSRKKPANMHTWWAMKEQHAESMRQWDENQAAATPTPLAKANESETEPAVDPEVTDQPRELAEEAGEVEEVEVVARDEKELEWELERERLESDADKERQEIERDTQRKIADAESEGRKRKAEIDQQAKADKAAVDKETAKKRRSLVRQGSKAQDELDLRLRRRKEAAQRRIFGAPREDL